MASAGWAASRKTTNLAAPQRSLERLTKPTGFFYIIAALVLVASMAATMLTPTAVRNSLPSILRSAVVTSRPTTIVGTWLHLFNAPLQARNMSAKSTSLLDAIAHRRSVYGLTSELTVPPARIIELCQTAVQQVPSAFNSQTTRLVVLLGDDHKAFWNDIVAGTLKSKQDAATWERSAPKIAGFGNAAATIVFFEHTATIRQMQERTPPLAALFPDWSEHTSGMHQYALWLAVSAEGMGANLQHYNFEPAVEKALTDKYGLPSGDLKMRAQLVFGKPADGAWPTTQKDKLPTSETVKVYGGKL